MNKYTILVVLAIIQGFSCDEEGGDPWKHDKQDSWGEDHPDCNGKEQSPINLLSSNNETQGKPIPLNGYSTKHKGSDLVLSNNGHTAKLSLENIPQEARPSITVEDHTYTLDEVHFHWGGGPGRGSEHLINWKQYDLEAHLVHRNSEMESVAEAAGQENGITVIALLYEERSGLFGYDSDIKAITSRLPIIQNEGNTARLTVRNFEFGKNFPLEKLKTYYNYEGSLTTPGCSEKVNWIVFDKIQGVAAGELKNFRSLFDAAGDPIVDNFRKVRDLNDRNVTRINTEEKKSIDFEQLKLDYPSKVRMPKQFLERRNQQQEE